MRKLDLSILESIPQVFCEKTVDKKLSFEIAEELRNFSTGTKLFKKLFLAAKEINRMSFLVISLGRY